MTLMSGISTHTTLNVSLTLSVAVLSMQVAPKTSYYHEYPNLLRTQVEVISDLNYLVCILFEI